MYEVIYFVKCRGYLVRIEIDLNLLDSCLTINQIVFLSNSNEYIYIIINTISHTKFVF